VYLPSTDRIQTRIEPKLKKAAEKVFSQIGISPTEAIRLFYRQVQLKKGLPFELKIPNEETLQALRDIDEGRNLKRYDDFDAMLADMGIRRKRTKKAKKAAKTSKVKRRA